jgi:spore maturation protein CgeB
MKYDYGDKNRKHSFEHENFYKTLKSMGFFIIYFDSISILKSHGKEEMNKKLWKLIKKENPILLFCSIFGDEFDKNILKKISNETNTITFNWFCDDHWRFDNFSRHWAHCFNYVSTTDKNALTKYEKIRYKNIIYTQWGCNHFHYKKYNMKKRFDVTFVGQPHGTRKEIIQKLKQNGIKIKCWGYGWKSLEDFPFIKKMIEFFKNKRLLWRIHNQIFKMIKNSTRISQKNMIKVFNQSKINLNLSNSSIEGSDQIKGRNFEIPGCGGFLLTNYINELENYYQNHKEIACFTNFDDLLTKITYYLEKEKKRKEIALNGYKKTINNHTYEKRFLEIFKKIGIL